MVIIFAVIGSAVSLSGGILLLLSRHRGKIAHYATAFAAGALLSAAFVDILPEAFKSGDTQVVSMAIFVGIIVFFLLEGTIHWFHRHRHHDIDEPKEPKPTDPIVPLLVIGDTIHDFIDGIAIAAGFLVSPMTGIIVTLAVAAHEIPQEIGDFGLMLSKGVKRSKVLLYNLISAISMIVGAIIFFVIGQQNELPIAPILGAVAGFFIYIAVSDIIPSIHHERSRQSIARDSLILILGAVVVGVAIYLLHGFIE